jgi:hypothetical protein
MHCPHYLQIVSSSDSPPIFDTLVNEVLMKRFIPNDTRLA